MSDRKQMLIRPLTDKPGFSAWFDGVIRITDPSYVTPRFPGVVPLDDLTVTFEEPGLWEVTATQMDRAPDERTGSLVMRRIAANPKEEDTETIELGRAAVDTGHIAIVAEKFGHIEDWEDYAEEMVGPGPSAGEVAHIQGTLVCQSGIGGGEYAVYGTRARKTGDLVRVTVDFTPSQIAWDLMYGGLK